MRSVGDLRELVASGHLPAGTAVYHRARSGPGGVVEGSIEAGGLRVGGVLYPSLSTAARAVSGHAANGWFYWRVRESGEALDVLRRQARGQ